MSVSTIFIILIILADLALKYFIFQKIKEYEGLKLLPKSVDQVHKRIDQIFVVDIPAPNDATKADPNEIDLSETDSHQIPKNVKLDIEGGDTLAPPGFQVKK